MAGLRDFLTADEIAKMESLEGEIAFFRAERRRIINRALMRRARERARTAGIREINERLAAE
jgi:hypothetical protein